MVDGVVVDDAAGVVVVIGRAGVQLAEHCVQ
jgi:hypothetical protein